MPDYSVPLAGSYNTRTSATNALSSASGIVGLGIVGVMIVGAMVQSTDKDQRFINCFSETVTNRFTGQTKIYCVKRPGFAALNTPRSGHIGTALLVWTGQGAGTKVMSAFGNTDSNIYDSTTSVGAITGKATAITETTISDVATLAITSTDNTGWYYTVALGVVTKITDADFPGNAGLTLSGTFAHMDGYAFVMDSTGYIWNSDVNSITSWNPINKIAANSYPDRGVAVVRNRSYIMAFGTESTQFFRNNGNPSGSPLIRIEESTLRQGCVSGDAITTIGNTTFWAGSSPQGGLRVSSFGDGGYKRVSTPAIEGILILAGAANISLTSIELNGRSFVVVNASSVTFVYGVDEDAWHEWNSTTRLWYKCAGVSSGSNQVFYSVSNTSTSGKVYTINPSDLTYQDDGMAYTARIQTSKMGDSRHRTFWHSIELVGDQETSSSTTTIQYTDDDYQTYNTLGTVDLMDERPRITRCGAAVRRAWVITNAANTPMRLEAMAGSRSQGA
jgi:hypothetical protein